MEITEKTIKIETVEELRQKLDDAISRDSKLTEKQSNHKECRSIDDLVEITSKLLKTFDSEGKFNLIESKIIAMLFKDKIYESATMSKELLNMPKGFKSFLDKIFDKDLDGVFAKGDL